MPNIVNRLSLREFTDDAKDMGSCIVVRFDKLTVSQASVLRERFRSDDVRFRVVKNRLAVQAFSECGYELPKLTGKCGVVFAPAEKAIKAAKLVRDFQKEHRRIALEVLAGVLEGEVISGPDAETIADMPDKDTVRAQIATAIRGPARALATVTNAVAGGLARCLQQRADGEGSSPEG